jgi:hypothetical protein
MTRDLEGHRTYKVKWLVRGDTTDGPANALQTSGLALPGDIWVIDGDVDVWAYCRQEASVNPLITNEPNSYFEVEQTFSTKPDEKRCKDQQIDDPLLRPQNISGGYTKYTEEATEDRFGDPITNSAHEQIRGPQVEFDRNRATVKIEQNVPLLQLELFNQMVNTVNDATLWGAPARCVKLGNVSWSKKYNGGCYAYYERVLDFEIFIVVDPDTGDLVSGFDKDILDEGTKALNGHWAHGAGTAPSPGGWELDNIAGLPPDPTNPTHFIRVQDRNGNTMRVILDGSGVPWDPDAPATAGPNKPGSIHVEKYQESDFLLLGIPTTF